MIFQKLWLPALAIITSSFNPVVRACTPEDSSSGPLVIGTDGAADPATVGYIINHFALVVSNLTATIEFYGNVLGLRHIFTFHASNDYDITYMGHSHGGKNGTGYQTGEELYKAKANTEGLIEFLSPRNLNATIVASTVRPNTFSHIGMVVPDIKRTQARMKEHNVNILKDLGQNPTPGDSVSDAFAVGSDAQAAAAVLLGIRQIGFENFLLISDPDGNLIEIQQQS